MIQEIKSVFGSSKFEKIVGFDTKPSICIPRALRQTLITSFSEYERQNNFLF